VIARLLLLLLLLCACAGEKNPLGQSEPIRVRNAVFKEGALPIGKGPEVTFVETQSLVLTQGQAAKNLAGRARPDARSIGLRVADLGSGYWVLVLGGPDPSAGGELTFSAQLDVGTGLPAGAHDLELVAFDDAGTPGPVRALKVCIVPEIPDNLAACDPSIAPPAAVLTLSWDAPVDLDLQLVTPEGKLVDGKHPSTVVPGDAGILKKDLDGAGKLDRDATCSAPIKRETIVWQQAPAPGTYFVYANLFDACGQPNVRFSLDFYQPEGSQLVNRLSRKGELLAIDANGGGKTGLYLTDLNFE
jgi:hypothetical protein